MPKGHLSMSSNIKCPINAEKPHTVILRILLMMQEESQSIREEADVWENGLYFIVENGISYLPLHSGLYLICISAL